MSDGPDVRELYPDLLGRVDPDTAASIARSFEGAGPVGWVPERHDVEAAVRYETGAITRAEYRRVAREESGPTAAAVHLGRSA
jgi:hypothetical protein